MLSMDARFGFRACKDGEWTLKRRSMVAIDGMKPVGDSLKLLLTEENLLDAPNWQNDEKVCIGSGVLRPIYSCSGSCPTTTNQYESSTTEIRILPFRRFGREGVRTNTTMLGKFCFRA